MVSVTRFIGRCEEMTSPPDSEVMTDSCLVNSTSTPVEFLYLTRARDLLHTAQLKVRSKGWSMFFFHWFIYSKSFTGISAGLFFFKEVHLILFISHVMRSSFLRWMLLTLEKNCFTIHGDNNECHIPENYSKTTISASFV